MITQIKFSAALLVFLVVPSQLAGAELGHDVLHGVHVPNCVCKRCCDDYCAKPMPPACGVRRFCCDDYCAKPLPGAACAKQTCCDDYCPKKYPCVFCPPRMDLKCGPTFPRCDKRTCPASMQPVPVAK